MRFHRSCQEAIIASDLMPSEKLVGLVVVFHINNKTRRTKLRKSTIAQECGLSQRSVRRAILSLIEAGIIEEEIDSGRSSYYRIPPSTNTSTVTHDTHVMGGVTPMSPLNDKIYKLDTEFSTTAEEKNKLDEASYQRSIIEESYVL